MVVQAHAASLERQLARALTDVEFAKERRSGQVKAVGQRQPDKGAGDDSRNSDSDGQAAAGGAISSSGTSTEQPTGGEREGGLDISGLTDDKIQRMPAEDLAQTMRRLVASIRASQQPSEPLELPPGQPAGGSAGATEAGVEAGAAAESDAGTAEAGGGGGAPQQRRAAAEHSVRQQQLRRQQEQPAGSNGATVLHRRRPRGAGDAAAGAVPAAGAAEKVYFDEEGQDFYLDDPFEDEDAGAPRKAVDNVRRHIACIVSWLACVLQGCCTAGRSCNAGVTCCTPPGFNSGGLPSHALVSPDMLRRRRQPGCLSAVGRRVPFLTAANSSWKACLLRCCGPLTR